MSRPRSLEIQGIALAIAIAASRVAAADPSAEPIWLESNLRELYPRRVEMCLVTYTQVSEPPGVVLSLRNEIEGFSHYRYTLKRDSLRAERVRESRTGSLMVRFDTALARSQRVEVVVEAVSAWGRRSRPYTIELAYHPREVYASARHRAPSWIVVEASDLSLCGSSIGDWIVEKTSDQDRKLALSRWGRLVKPLRGDYDKAKAVARDLARSLKPHNGIPSSRMGHLRPFEQLARAEAGQDQVWCANYADIFGGALNALGIAARKIDMQYVWSSRDKTNFEVAEGHRTTEMFDPALDRWVWMDLTFGILGAQLDGEMLNMAELVQALHDERRMDRLRLVEIDPVSGIERIGPAKASRNRKNLLRFFRNDQRYQYARCARTAGR